MKRTYFILLIATLAAPISLHAALTFGSLIELADTLAGGVVRSLGYLLFTLAVVAFFWGMVQFIWNARQGNASKGMENGKQFMLWGLIALFVMFSVWGIIQWAQSVLDIRGQTSIVIPRIRLMETTGTGQQACPAGQTRNATGACVTAAAGSTTGDCSGIASEVQRDACFRNLPTCNNIASEVQRNACFEAKAEGSSDPSGACAGMTEVQRDNCFRSLPSCNNIQSESVRNQCFAAKAGGTNGCTSPQVAKDGGGGCVTPGTTCQGTNRDMATGQTTSFTSEWTQTGTCPRPSSGASGATSASGRTGVGAGGSCRITAECTNGSGLTCDGGVCRTQAQIVEACQARNEVKISQISYPVASLGNCSSRQACSWYCNQPGNQQACSAHTASLNLETCQ